ncbi:hypothetical protein DFH09DRAFT_1074317 [Mycena vulgaris]|nr:hypothetical protein DFH09DRAFT_1074317 [Mycena vulgaris]
MYGCVKNHISKMYLSWPGWHQWEVYIALQIYSDRLLGDGEEIRQKYVMPNKPHTSSSSSGSSSGTAMRECGSDELPPSEDYSKMSSPTAFLYWNPAPRPIVHGEDTERTYKLRWCRGPGSTEGEDAPAGYGLKTDGGTYITASMATMKISKPEGRKGEAEDLQET